MPQANPKIDINTFVYLALQNIIKEQAGTEQVSNTEELYWLFTLGESLLFKNVINLEWDPHFKINFVGRDDLSTVTDWDELKQRYASLMI